MIVVDAVSKRFGAIVALDRVSLVIEPGERVALIGANGSGKTTLLRAMVGLLRAEGRVSIGGFDVRTDPTRALAHLAYVPQIAPPIDAPVSEVVRLFARLRNKRVDEVALRARRLGLSLSDVASTRFRDLSGGTKQRVLAALGLAADAPVLVCDEPTASLDIAARAAFFDEVAARAPASILVLCSHRKEEVDAMVSRVIELAEGRVVRDEQLSPRGARPAQADGPLGVVLPIRRTAS